MSCKGDSEDTDASSRNSKLYRLRAPIASMDAMEDMDLLSGSNTHLSKLSSECNIMAGGAAQTKTTFPGLKYRHIGKTGLKVSNIALGSIKVFNQNVDAETAEEIVTMAYENGINYFDICDPSGTDRAEQEIGRIVRKKGWDRRSYVISTRVYWHRTELGCLSRKEIIESVNQSLRNLGLEYIDLLIIHKNDPNCPLEEVLRACTYLINNGKIMYWGTSRWSPFELFEAYHKAKEYGVISPIVEIGEYHWFHREKVELYMAELYNKIGLGLMGWSPISFGITLGEKQEDSQALITKIMVRSAKFQPTNTNKPVMDSVNMTSETNAGMGGFIGSAATNTNSQGMTTITANVDPIQSKVKALAAIAEKLGCNLLQLQVAWQVRNQTVQSTTISACTPDALMELLHSLTIIPKLNYATTEDIDKILGNKPARPPMISTLQSRWATTGGVPVPPC